MASRAPVTARRKRRAHTRQGSHRRPRAHPQHHHGGAKSLAPLAGQAPDHHQEGGDQEGADGDHPAAAEHRSGIGLEGDQGSSTVHRFDIVGDLVGYPERPATSRQPEGSSQSRRQTPVTFPNCSRGGAVPRPQPLLSAQPGRGRPLYPGRGTIGDPAFADGREAGDPGEQPGIAGDRMCDQLRLERRGRCARRLSRARQRSRRAGGGSVPDRASGDEALTCVKTRCASSMLSWSSRSASASSCGSCDDARALLEGGRPHLLIMARAAGGGWGRG